MRDLAMRILIAILGFGAAGAGLALMVYQAILRVENGTWTPILFGDLWFALGGSVPEQYEPGHLQDFLARLLEQPLSLILLLVGGIFAWVGTAGKSNHWRRL